METQMMAEGARPNVVVERNRGEAQSRTLFGTDTTQPQFKLTVSGNEAGRGAMMGAGVLSREAIQALLGQPPAANIVLAVQNGQNPQDLRAQSPGVRYDHISGGNRHGAIEKPPLSPVVEEESPLGHVRALDERRR